MKLKIKCKNVKKMTNNESLRFKICVKILFFIDKKFKIESRKSRDLNMTNKKQIFANLILWKKKFANVVQIRCDVARRQ